MTMQFESSYTLYLLNGRKYGVLPRPEGMEYQHIKSW